MKSSWLSFVSFGLVGILIGVGLAILLIKGGVFQPKYGDYAHTIRVSEPASCTAVIVGGAAVLTAAHCAGTSGKIPEDRGSLVGRTLQLESPHWTGGLAQRATAKVVAVHTSRDLALGCFGCKPQAAPSGFGVAIFSTDAPVANDEFTAVGYGQTGGAYLYPSVGESLVGSLQSATFVATLGNSVACPGDSGGPALTDDGKVFGIVEGWAEPNSNCGSDVRYARVDLGVVQDWIVKTAAACSLALPACTDGLSMPVTMP